jgi:drug/metabolite transporter (DMT)-like permease
MNTTQITALMFSSILSVLIFWIFKEMGRRKEKALPVIVINYVVCMVLGNIVLGETHLLKSGTLTKEGVWPIFFLGFLFMVTFLFMAESTRESGASLSAVASKMSMVIPVSSALFLFDEEISAELLIGISLALLSVGLITYQSENKGGFSWLLIAVFVGSGGVDLSMNLIKHQHYSGWSNLQFTTLTFSGATVTGLLYTLWKWLNHGFEIKILPSTLFFGVLLGGINLFSIYAIYHALDVFESSSSVFFTVNNVLVVMGSVTVGLVYKEGFNTRKIIGLIAAVFALILLG